MHDTKKNLSEHEACKELRNRLLHEAEQARVRAEAARISIGIWSRNHLGGAWGRYASANVELSTAQAEHNEAIQAYCHLRAAGEEATPPKTLDGDAAEQLGYALRELEAGLHAMAASEDSEAAKQFAHSVNDMRKALGLGD